MNVLSPLTGRFVRCSLGITGPRLTKLFQFYSTDSIPTVEPARENQLDELLKLIRIMKFTLKHSSVRLIYYGDRCASLEG